MKTLSKDQQIAADKFMSFLLDPEPGEMTLEGHAGTGKTFMTEYFINLANSTKAMNSLVHNFLGSPDIVLTATTNKAASVLSKMSGQDVSTIHSLLSLKPVKNFKTGNTNLVQKRSFSAIENTLIIIDEASMIDSQLLDIIRKSAKNCKVLFILDSFQLAPVKESNIPVATEIANKAILTTIHRQEKGNPIIDLAEGYRQAQISGKFPKIITNDKEIIRVDGQTFKEMINEEFDSIDHDVNKAKILAYRNETVNVYNKHVRSLHTESDKFMDGEYVTTNKPIMLYGKGMLPTDAVLQIDHVEDQTTYIHDIECWVIHALTQSFFMPVNPLALKTKLRTVKAEVKKGDSSWAEYFTIAEAFVDFRPAYASTIHKSQGSTYERAFINLYDIGTDWKEMDVARKVYVALTRAAKQVILYDYLGDRYNDKNPNL